MVLRKENDVISVDKQAKDESPVNGKMLQAEVSIALRRIEEIGGCFFGPKSQRGIARANLKCFIERFMEPLDTHVQQSWVYNMHPKKLCCRFLLHAGMRELSSDGSVAFLGTGFGLRMESAMSKRSSHSVFGDGDVVGACARAMKELMKGCRAEMPTVLVPINYRSHWGLLLARPMCGKEGEICWGDSLRMGPPEGLVNFFHKVVENAWANYTWNKVDSDFMLDKLGFMPQQDEYSCGFYVLAAMSTFANDIGSLPAKRYEKYDAKTTLEYRNSCVRSLVYRIFEGMKIQGVQKFSDIRMFYYLELPESSRTKRSFSHAMRLEERKAINELRMQCKVGKRDPSKIGRNFAGVRRCDSRHRNVPGEGGFPVGLIYIPDEEFGNNKIENPYDDESIRMSFCDTEDERYIAGEIGEEDDFQNASTGGAPGRVVHMASGNLNEGLREKTNDATEYIQQRELIPLYCEKNDLRFKMASRNVFYHSSPSDLRKNSKIEIFSKEGLTWRRGNVIKLRNGEHDTEKDCVTIKYLDRTEEIITDLAKRRWRLLSEEDPFPLPSWKTIQSTGSYYRRAMRKARAFNASGKDKIVVFGPEEVSALDFISLENDAWITDQVIKAFAYRILRMSRSKSNHRFAALCVSSSLEEVSATKCSREILLPLMNGFELHDIDVILWPIHQHKRKHWVLCVAFTRNLEYLILDPFNARSRTLIEGELAEQVAICLESISRSYANKYKDHRVWRQIRPWKLAVGLNLPVQPKGNSNDCGVLVCLYIWAIVVGARWPDVKDSAILECEENRDGPFARCMEEARVTIGSIITQKHALPNDMRSSKP